MKQDLENILKYALTPTIEPDFWLNQKILRQAREEKELKKRKINKIPIPAAALALALVMGIGSLTTFAAWKLLGPKQVAEEVQDRKLIEAFSDEEAIFVNESQNCAGYQVTFLGIVSGKSLSDGMRMRDGEIHEDRSHIVVAIENADGTPMPDTSEDAYGELAFFVSPYIKGYHPCDYNAATMSGNYADIVEEGVLYRILECDNVEIFAHAGLYLGVSEGMFYNAKAYLYNDETGEISRNTEYRGLNALFSMSVDATKADQEAAELYLESYFDQKVAGSVGTEEESNTEDVTIAVPEGVDREEWEKVEDWLANLSSANLEEVAVRVESSVQIIMIDEEGYLNIGAYEVKGRGGSDGKKILESWAFPDVKPGMINWLSNSHSGTFETLRVETLTKNEDGTYTFAVYIPK